VRHARQVQGHGHIRRRLDSLREALAPGAAIEKAHQLLRDFNETLPTLKALGLSVSDMSFKSQLNGLGFAGIRMDVRLGLCPSVQIGLLTSSAIAGGPPRIGAAPSSSSPSILAA
jgi:hypothetical protein